MTKGKIAKKKNGIGIRTLDKDISKFPNPVS